MNSLEALLKALPTNPYGFATVCVLVGGGIIIKLMELWSWRKKISDKKEFSRLEALASSNNENPIVAQSDPLGPPKTGILVLVMIGAAALSAIAGGIHSSIKMARRPNIARPLQDADIEVSSCPDCSDSRGCKCNEETKKCKCPSKTIQSDGTAGKPRSLAATLPWFNEAVSAWPVRSRKF